MRRLPLQFSLLIVSFFAFLLAPLFAFASFSEVYIRVDRQQTSTATTGLICAEPATNGTENTVQVTFPSGFTVSSAEGNWTVATTNLPSGATAWPGISTASGASGQTVTFPSGNLNVGTLYCFRWTNSAALTTASTANSYSGSITTRDSGSGTVDTSNLTLSLLSSDQLSVSATVPASPSDFQADLSSTTTGPHFPQNTTIDYQLDYGSYLSSATNITVEAEWSLGTVKGSGTPSVELLDYVVSSASDGYGGVSPVIDLTNRKITWTINSFPANTVNQSVTFQLKTNASYTGSPPVDFSVTGRVLGPGTQSVDSAVTQSYKYASGAHGPTATPTPGTTATTTPTPAPASAFAFADVEIRSVSDKEARVYVSTNKESRLVVIYGKSPLNLNQRVNVLSSSVGHLVTLGDLEPATDYYFRLTATDAAGKSITSDTFSFTSAKVSTAPAIDIASIIFTSLGNILSQPDLERKKAPIIVVVTGSPYGFGFTVPDNVLIKRVQIFIRNKNVLGISNVYAQDLGVESDSVDVIEIGKGNYRGHLKSPLVSGIYELYARIHDENGNVTENLIGEIKVTKPFTLLDKKTKDPIESARVFFSVYNPERRVFDAIPSDAFVTKNPSYSNLRGEVIFPLPLATYKAEVLAIGYGKQEVEFTLGPNPGEDYPIIYLERSPFSLTDSFFYFMIVATDLVDQLNSLVANLSNSFRFFDLLAIVVLLIFGYLTALAFSYRVKIPLNSYLLHLRHKKEIKSLDKTETISAKIYDEQSRTPISNADVFLLRRGELNILAHAKTDSTGKFTFVKLPRTLYDIQVLEEGYENTFFNETKVLTASKKNEPLYIHKHTHAGITFKERGRILFRRVVGISFEAFLLFSLALELLFGSSLGWWKASPFILLSSLNLILWLDHGFNKTIIKNID